MDWKHDEEEVLKPKHVPTKTANQESKSSQENNDDDVSGLDDDVSDREVAQSSQQEGDGEERSRIVAGSPAILSEVEDLRMEMDAKSQTESEAKLKAELKAAQNEVHRLSNENNDLKAQAEANSKTRAEDADADSAQDELRRLRDEVETKNGEITRLRHELPTTAAAAQESTPDYIVEAYYICLDRVAFGNEGEGKAVLLDEVSEALNNRDEKTIQLVKYWIEHGRSAEEVVDGLVNIKMVQIKRKG